MTPVALTRDGVGPTGSGTGIGPGFEDGTDVDELAQLLEHECQAVERIRYRASLAVLLLRSGEARFLPRISDELHQAVDQLAELELERALAVARLAGRLSVDEDELTLSWIIARAPQALRTRLGELQERLRDGLGDLHAIVHSGAAMASHDLEALGRSLGRWTGTPAAAGYGAVPAPGPSRFDRSV